MRKIIGFITGISGLALTSAGAFLIFKITEKKPSVSIIGGADTPTAVFIAGRSGIIPVAAGIIAGIVLIIISVFLLLRKKH